MKAEDIKIGGLYADSQNPDRWQFRVEYIINDLVYYRYTLTPSIMTFMLDVEDVEPIDTFIRTAILIYEIEGFTV